MRYQLPALFPEAALARALQSEQTMNGCPCRSAHQGEQVVYVKDRLLFTHIEPDSCNPLVESVRLESFAPLNNVRLHYRPTPNSKVQ